MKDEFSKFPQAQNHWQKRNKLWDLGLSSDFVKNRKYLYGYKTCAPLLGDESRLMVVSEQKTDKNIETRNGGSDRRGKQTA